METYKKHNNTYLYQGDSIQIMKDFEDCIFDLTVTSPPYDNLRTYKDSLDWGEHVWKTLLQELYRTTKQGCVVVWVVGDSTVKGSETGTSFKQALFAMECGFNLYDTMIFTKHGMPTDPRLRYFQRFEYMFVLSKGRPKSYNPIKDVVSSGRKQYNGVDRVGDKLVQTNKTYQTQDLCIRGNVWDYDCRNMGGHHPAMFPEKLALDHILSWSNEGDIVFDPFMGSGTTGKMAVLNNRNFVGVEKVSEYFKISEDRINNALNTQQGT